MCIDALLSSTSHINTSLDIKYVATGSERWYQCNCNSRNVAWCGSGLGKAKQHHTFKTWAAWYRQARTRSASDVRAAGVLACHWCVPLARPPRWPLSGCCFPALTLSLVSSVTRPLATRPPVPGHMVSFRLPYFLSFLFPHLFENNAH